MIKDSVIKIIPKPKAQVSSKVNFLVLVSGILLVLCVGISLLLSYYLNPVWIQKRTELQNTLAGLNNQSDLELENDIVATAEKTNDFATLWVKHQFVSQIFNFLKTICHKRVMIKSVNVGLENNVTLVTFSAVTDHFKTLGEQLLSLRSNPKIVSLNASEISLGQEGVSFIVTMGLSDEVLKPPVQ
jgi:hypothetical protein